MSSGAQERTDERSGAREQSEQYGASKWVSDSSEQVSDEQMAQYSTRRIHILSTLSAAV